MYQITYVELANDVVLFEKELMTLKGTLNPVDKCVPQIGREINVAKAKMLVIPFSRKDRSSQLGVQYTEFVPDCKCFSTTTLSDRCRMAH